MAHFLLFLPGARGQSPALLESVGLADFVAGAEFTEIGQGPTDQPGVLVAWRKPGGDSRFHFAADQQAWTPAAAGGPAAPGLAAGRYWVGTWKDAPPTPVDLLRPYHHGGRSIELGDGNTWRFPEKADLPHDAIMADDGSYRFELQRKFHAFAIEAGDWLTLLGNESATFDYGKLVAFLVLALSLNYRLTPEVVSGLRLFNTNNLREPLFAVTGMTSMAEKLTE